jgi:hypothetical protein
MKKLTCCLVFIWLFLSMNHAYAQDAKFQSLIIYNFTKLLDWPGKMENFTIKILGNAELYKELKEYVVDRKVGGTLEFDIQKAEPGMYENCQMLFVGMTECGNLDQIIKTMQGKSVLIITEKPDLIVKGAGISLVKIDGAWNYQYNEENIKKLGIKISLDFKELGIPK